MSDQNPETPTPAEQPASRAVLLRTVKPTATYVLMAVMVVFYLAQVLTERFTGTDLLFLYMGKIKQFILAGQLWRFITPAFLHGSVLHIASNLYALYVLGLQLEGIYGHRRFLLLFFVAALAEMCSRLCFLPPPLWALPRRSSVLLGADIVFVLQNRSYLGGRSRGLLTNLVVVLLLNLMIGFNPALNIDYFGHLGGLVAGSLFAYLAGPKWQLQWSEFQPELKDSRSLSEIRNAGLIVFLGFCLIAAIPFIFHG